MMSRLYLLLFFIFAVSFVLIFRLFSLQILQYDFYKELATNQHQIYQILFPKRGEIFIKDRFYGKDSSSQLVPLAINREWLMVYAVPKDIQDKESAVKALAPLLEIDEEDLRQKLNKRNDPYEPLKHKLSPEVVQKIKELNIQGIDLAPETWRYFPAGSLACHITGFIGFSGDEKAAWNAAASACTTHCPASARPRKLAGSSTSSTTAPAFRHRSATART